MLPEEELERYRAEIQNDLDHFKFLFHNLTEIEIWLDGFASDRVGLNEVSPLAEKARKLVATDFGFFLLSVLVGGDPNDLPKLMLTYPEDKTKTESLVCPKCNSVYSCTMELKVKESNLHVDSPSRLVHCPLCYRNKDIVALQKEK